MFDLVRPTLASPRWPIGSTSSVWFAFALLVAHLLVMFGLGFVVMLAIGLDPRELLDAPPLAFVALVIAGGLDVGLVFVLLMRGVGRYQLRDLGWARFVARDIAMGLAGAAGLIGARTRRPRCRTTS